MLGQNKFQTKILGLTLLIMAIAAVLSIAGTVFADNGEEVASFRTMSTAKIKGSENVPDISVSKFLHNTLENTGINSIVNGSEEMTDLSDASKTVWVMGWQRLVMMAIGFLIIYLGAAKGFRYRFCKHSRRRHVRRTFGYA